MSQEISFDHAGVRVFAVEDGAGPPIVLLHGGLANHTACWQYARPLTARFRVITPDLRGSGRSIHPGPLDWDQLAGDVAALIRHLGLGRAAVGGASFGAGCATAVALRHPDVVSALIAIHPAFAGADTGLTAAQTEAMEAMDAAGRRVVAEGVEVLLPLFANLPPAIRDRARQVIATYDPASVAATTAFMRSSAQPFASGAELAAIAVPTLVIPGVDPYHPAEVAEVYRRHIPRCTVVETADFATAIEQFLDYPR